MRLGVVMTPAEMAGRRFDGQVVVVIDVLRATSTIAAALANGCSCIYPVESVEEAFTLRESLAPDRPLLGGERRGLRIDGFDLGNSPAEYSREAVGGRAVILTTTNGTVAIRAAKGADELWTCAFSDLNAIARALVELDRDTVIACAGRSGQLSLEDAVCAGALVRRVTELAAHGTALELDDGAMAAKMLALGWSDPMEVLQTSAHGRYLVDVGLGDDLAWCAAVDRYDAVVAYVGGHLSLVRRL